ncbi:MAG TPA: hypothetical protein VFL79_06775 [Terriglobia bacterium]|nr:hypothetical protein [Terriglobia bacterium]
MKNFKLLMALSCAVMMAGAIQLGWGATPAFGQAQATADSAASSASSTAAAATTKGQSAEIKNGTKISADLMSNIDARKAKEGDKVVARVTRNVKQHGKVVVHKGDRLVGHVTSVKNSLNGKGGSSLGVQFDQLVQGDSTTHLNTVLTSVLSAESAAEGSDSMAMPSMPTPVAAPAGGGGGGGGLLGGAGGAVGSTVGSTVGAAGSTLGQAGGAVGATTQNTLGANSNLGLSTPVRQIHIGSSASGESSVGTNSMLSTRKGNLRLASGTHMNFRVAADSSARASR